MKNTRRAVYQGMVSYIQKTTIYSLEDIASVINVSCEDVIKVMQSQAYPDNRKAELNLTKLYAIALDLHLLSQSYGKDGNANL